MSTDTKLAEVRLRGAAANNFIAAALVDMHGEAARERVCGPMLVAVNAILAARQEHEAAQPEALCANEPESGIDDAVADGA